MSTRFVRDTAVRLAEPNVYEGEITRAWWIVRGPNGGYIAALLTRAMEAAIGEPERTLRSLNVHYLRPPAEGPVRIHTQIERTGRGLSTISARMIQGDKLQALATAAFAKSRGGETMRHHVMPEVPPPEACAARESVIPFHAQFESRVAIGPTDFESSARSEKARGGGWLRLAEPQPLDGAALAAFTDAWPPAVFSAAGLERFPTGVPTVDLTVHVRSGLPAEVPEGEFVLVVFETRHIQDGFLEEDGQIWSRDGQLLAHSRQLAVAL